MRPVVLHVRSRRRADFTLAAFCDKPRRVTRSSRMAGDGNDTAGKGWSWARLLLVLPFLGILSVPFYNSVEPTLLSVPFFYWYQMLWILLCAAAVTIVYVVES
jgi:hypothetical protein